MTSFPPGSLVRARGREWVVLPESADDLLLLRPLGGTDDEVAGVYVPLEPVEPAAFDLPDPSRVGDHRSSRLLRDAVRLGFRSSAGPFRSFARIAVEPRPYQLVPLLMALRLDPVRLLIADDVGIGKTIEAGLIARELLDRGEVTRLAVLCPPHLTDQWEAELREKFHIDCEVVIPGTARSLERRCAVGQSLFEVYPHVIVSLDFIKSERHRHEFLRSAPELVIVDEAHTCALPYARGGGARHLRHELLRGLAERPDRHLILVTATPHSGKDDAFRSLLCLLSPDFADLPEDLGGKHNEPRRRQLAAHLVQRRRADIREYLDASTPFPERDPREETYQLSPAYRKLFDRVLRYAREIVREADGTEGRRRVRWWAALGLLRALGSSPAAAAASLRSRAGEAASVEDADDAGSRSVLDLDPEETLDASDVAPAADATTDAEDTAPARQQLLELARAAEALEGAGDEKLKKAAALVAGLVQDGFRPIVFCRFIATAEYLAAHLRKKLDGVEVAAVTGTLPPDERAERVAKLGQAPRHVLVATDCLSEGINLQEHFDAVLHYDLSWNPTRHEQREGRVDRYGQPRPLVRTVTYYGVDNRIDGLVLDVLLRKHRAIHSSLGISVPVPVDPKKVVEAIFEGLLLREGAKQSDSPFKQSLLFEEYFQPQKTEVHKLWEAAAEREKRSRSLFAQHTVRVEQVKNELEAVREAVGSVADRARFLEDAVRSSGGTVAREPGPSGPGSSSELWRFDLRGSSPAFQEAAGGTKEIVARFELPVPEGAVLLGRTHPIVEGIAAHVLESALDSEGDGPARRAGAVRTRQVARRTTLLLLRYRFHVIVHRGPREERLLAEEAGLLAFEGAPESALWLEPSAAEALLGVSAEGNIHAEQAADHVRKILAGFEHLRPRLEESARERAALLAAAHERVRTVRKRDQAGTESVEPQLPVDVLGVYVCLPAGGSA